MSVRLSILMTLIAIVVEKQLLICAQHIPQINIVSQEIVPNISIFRYSELLNLTLCLKLQTADMIRLRKTERISKIIMAIQNIIESKLICVCCVTIDALNVMAL